MIAIQDKEKRNSYYPELDGLRFFAFLLVFIHNSPEYSFGPVWQLVHEYGWIGVDLFFCISSYLITKILTSEHDQKGYINVKHFYLRRILRIWPLYFLYLFFSIYFITQTQGWDSVLFVHLFGLITFSYNFVYLLLTYKMYIVLVHLWSISYEMQFYFFIPHIIKIFLTWSKRNRFIFTLLVFITGSGLRFFFIARQVEHPAIYMLPITHFEALLGGFLLGSGTLAAYLKKTNKWVVLITGIICNVLVFCLPNTYVIGWNLMFTYLLAGIGMTLIVIFVLTNDSKHTLPLFNSQFIRHLGTISYGLYIYHLLIISLTSNTFNILNLFTLSQHGARSFSLFTVSLLLTIIVSSISYSLIELPFLKLKLRYTTDAQ